MVIGVHDNWWVAENSQTKERGNENKLKIHENETKNKQLNKCNNTKVFWKMPAHITN